MPKPPDLNLWYRYPGNITGEELLAEAERRGWVVRSVSGSHFNLKKAGVGGLLTIPRHVAANGTKRDIIRKLMEAQDAETD